MYKATVRALVRHTIGRLNEGDPGLLLRLAAPDASCRSPATTPGHACSGRWSRAGTAT